MLPAMGEREAGAPWSDVEIERLDLDPKRANWRALCPFCGGEWIAAYFREPKPGGAVATVMHTEPLCEPFTSSVLEQRVPRLFVEAAKRAGARPRPLFEQ